MSRISEEYLMETPCLFINLSEIDKNFHLLSEALPCASIYYAVKANPHPEVLRRLVSLGSNFDAASIYEIEQCIEAGALPNQISFGNTIKKTKDIKRAYKLGINLFTFDSLEELEKIAINAPGSKVYCRLLVETTGAVWPLSRKFGCPPAEAFDLMVCANHLGLVPYGLSFHVGSQQMDPTQWGNPIATAFELFSKLAYWGIDLKMLNLGGGFPGTYESKVPDKVAYGNEIMKSVNHYFGEDITKIPQLMIEPGRGIASSAGVIHTEVVLISNRSGVRWVFLDIGKFSGLNETNDEAVRYKLVTPYSANAITTPVILAGPTCDSADILYEKNRYHLPIDLKVGDLIEIHSTGAYTHSYSTVGFNGFPPLKVYIKE